MFLYPLSRMTGGIYYEHAHRLFGALVGLTVIAQAGLFARYEGRRRVRWMAWLAVGMVAVQGLLGGLRVTGGLTLSSSAEILRPNLALAMVHGVFGQVCFALLVALAVMTSRAWSAEGPARPHPSARVERTMAVALVSALLGQLVIGAAQRHFSVLLFAHILLGVTLVAPLALHVGFRAWAGHEGGRLGRSGLLLATAAMVQVLGGFAAYTARGGAVGPVFSITVRTAHQWLGAALLAAAILQLCWTFRLLTPVAAILSDGSPHPGRSAAPDRVY
jgi:cytochrome c oxidase assembly protein subunit 15